MRIFNTESNSFFDNLSPIYALLVSTIVILIPFICLIGNYLCPINNYDDIVILVLYLLVWVSIFYKVLYFRYRKFQKIVHRIEIENTYITLYTKKYSFRLKNIELYKNVILLSSLKMKIYENKIELITNNSIFEIYKGNFLNQFDHIPEIIKDKCDF